MGFLRKLFGAKDEDLPEVEVVLDVEQRRAQLLRLERALDALVAGMKEQPTSLSNPGWRIRVTEYGRLAGEAMRQRSTAMTRESLLDLVFEIRPLFSGPVPPGMDDLLPLQDEVMAAAEDLRELLPSEH